MVRYIILLSTFISSAFYINAQKNCGYEVWVDDKYENRQWQTSTNDGSVSLYIDYTGLNAGIHFLNMRAVNADGWSALSRMMAYIPGNDIDDADFAYFESWIDDNYGSVQKSKSKTSTLSTAGYTPGMHYINFRAINSNGYASAFKRMMFIIPDEKDFTLGNIIGYKYGFGEKTNYVSLAPNDYITFDDENPLVFDIPKLSECQAITDDEDFSFTQDTATLSREANSVFTFQALGDNGAWSELKAENVAQKQTITHAYRDLAVNTLISADIPDIGDFVTFKINITEKRPYTLKTSKAVKLKLYNQDGILFATNDSKDDMLSGYRTESMPKGTYYGVIYGVANVPAENGKFIVKLFDKNESLVAPEINYIDGKVQIISDEGAEIRYTIDGTDPTKEGTLYQGEFEINHNCTIKVVVIYGNETSPVSTYEVKSFKVETPKASVTETEIILECDTPEVEIYYTLDGSDPTEYGIKYTSAISITANATLQAIAKREGYIDSEILSIEVKAPTPTCQAPVFNLDGTMLTITTNTIGGTIYYTIGDEMPTENTIKYIAPIQLTDNRAINAIAYADGYKPSDVVTYVHDTFICAPATVSYDGRYLSLSSAEPNAVIYYTLDGTEPTPESYRYLGTIDVSGTCTVHAIVTKDYFIQSPIVEYVIPVYYDGKTACVTIAGNLSKGFEWCGKDNVSALEIKGNLNDDDFGAIKTLSSLRHLDISEVECQSEIPNEAFANTDIISISLPSSINSIGNNIFAGCNNISAVIWNAKAQIPAAVFNGMDNPNLLLYVGKDSYATATSVRNVVVEGKSKAITLSDGENYNFYCPIPFDANKITYTHQYTMKSGTEKSAGWETLTLPFNVSRILHDDKEEITPFAANDDASKHFWLYELGDNGFMPAKSVVAYTPYIISMPNNEIYDPAMNLTKPITFVGENTTIEATAYNTVNKAGYTFAPTTMRQASTLKYAINRYVEAEGYLPGGGFVYEFRDISPFEAYFMHDNTVMPMKAFGIFDLNDNASTPDIISNDANLYIYTVGSDLFIKSSIEREIEIYSLSGALIKCVHVDSGINVINNLLPGFYIINHRKVIIN